MKITRVDGEVLHREFSEHAFTGIFVKSVEIDTRDVQRMLAMSHHDPDTFSRTLFTLQRNFVSPSWSDSK